MNANVSKRERQPCPVPAGLATHGGPVRVLSLVAHGYRTGGQIALETSASATRLITSATLFSCSALAQYTVASRMNNATAS